VRLNLELPLELERMVNKALEKDRRLRYQTSAELAVDPRPAEQMIRQAVANASRIFIDLDCDVLDPAYFPAVSHPLPFGLSPSMLLRLLDAAWSDRLVGLAVSEFDPARDRNDQSLATLVWLLEYLLLKKHEAKE